MEHAEFIAGFIVGMLWGAWRATSYFINTQRKGTTNGKR